MKTAVRGGHREQTPTPPYIKSAPYFNLKSAIKYGAFLILWC
jgi:hypothetical protein